LTENVPNSATWQATTQKSRRCYHRVMSGLEKGGDFRFLTLTSSNESPDTCQRSFRALYMRLKRRGLISAYIKIPEPSKNGKQHLHVLFRGSYVSQAYISQAWQEIHKAKIIDIRKVHQNRGKRALASYMAKYMAKDGTFRYSWSWSWVWKGFCGDWKRLKKLWYTLNQYSAGYSYADLLRWWRLWIKGFWKPDFSALPQPVT